MIKGPEGQSLVIDLFHVTGGAKHAYRTYSEIAASDTEKASLAFLGVDMPPEPPLPQVGASLDQNDIFGLRDLRNATPDGPWAATWTDTEGGYRLWMLSPCDRVEASNGPGQRSLDETGRRVRYVDTIREGENLDTTFIAIHEPATSADTFIVQSAESIPVTDSGPHAIAIRLATTFGDYLIFNDFDNPAEIDNCRFQGTFAVLKHDGDTLGPWMTVGAAQLIRNETMVDDSQPTITATVTNQTPTQLTLDISGLPEIDPKTQAYLRANVDGTWTGFPIATTQDNTVEVKDYPLPPMTEIKLLTVRYRE